MTKQQLFEQKLKADELLASESGISSHKIYEIANALDAEIVDLQSRLEKLQTIYQVYHGLDELGFLTKQSVADQMVDYALQLAKNGQNGYHVLDLLFNAVQDGSQKAVVEYAHIIAYGKYGVSPSPWEAYNWLERHAEGNAEACYCITLLHVDFPHVVEGQVAYDYCQKSASLGYSPAIKRLSQPFDLRTYTQKLVDRANNGDTSVYFQLSTRQDLSTHQQSAYLALALQSGNAQAEFLHASELEQGGDTELAKTFYQRAGQHGSAQAFVKLAELATPQGGEPYHNFSKLDVTPLPLAYHKQQFNYHVQAMQLGHALATVYVGIGHMQGYVTSQNNQMAFNCFAKAVELGEEFLGAFHLARCYHFGIGVDVDENCAVLYYTMSAERGNVSAMLALAQIYQDGLGSIPKDQQKSAKYLFMSGVGRP